MDSTLAGFLGVLMGALLSLLSNLVVSRRQTETSLKAIKVETLQRKITRLETALCEYSKVSFDISKPIMTYEEMMGNGMCFFSNKVSVTKNIQYLLPEGLVEQLVTLDREIGGLIYNEKVGVTNNLEKTKEIFTRVQNLDSELPDTITNELRCCQNALDKELG